MGRKRARRTLGNAENKRQRPLAKKDSLTDLDYISRDDYVTLGDFMYVRPYVFEFRMNFKPRWRHQTVFNVFRQEFKHADAAYWEREVAKGRILHNGKPISMEMLWDDGVEIVHVVHRHESAVLSTRIEIPYDTGRFVVVSKPPSIPIHPCGTYRRNSLTFILRAFYGTGKLMAVHRLDKETSGLVILAKKGSVAAKFSAEIKEHKVRKTYLAEVYGNFPEKQIECNEPLYWDKREMIASVRADGAEAKTAFRKISVSHEKGTSIVECKPLTGRTHQIRIHLAHLGYGIVNDPLYGPSPDEERPRLDSTKDHGPGSLKVTDSIFQEDSILLNRRRTYLACEWSKASLSRKGRHLGCAEEGAELSCLNCPQVTNLKNVGVRQMFIHLHALKYESDDWKFEVPPPPWMPKRLQEDQHNEARSSCAVS